MTGYDGKPKSRNISNLEKSAQSGTKELSVSAPRTVPVIFPVGRDGLPVLSAALWNITQK